MLLVACTNDPESVGQPASGGPQTLATNLGVPWGIAFLPDGSALIAERDIGTIQHMTQPGVVNSVGGVPGVAPRGEGGLL
ncbi:MAG: PQQ-dependent sugar dehydrogenase, partial [Mycobacterium sp.]|nr:PQQ-dependent sugar dehydrogenase [Mycobacterium sp.]